MTSPTAADATGLRADPSSRTSLQRAIARRLTAAGWRFRRGSSAPWIPPGPREGGEGYSLLGAAARQAEREQSRRGRG